MAVRIITTLAALLLSHFLSAAAAPFCGPDKPWLHASEFPGYVENALNYVVQNAASGYEYPGAAQGTDVDCSNYNPAQKPRRRLGHRHLLPRRPSRRLHEVSLRRAAACPAMHEADLWRCLLSRSVLAALRAVHAIAFA
ncbi:unnamed protein product [Linum trigynum]|uniref:Uncharacterized protein n=1 Tax=Linum trigynum TaxID=586398 RepID=A0AAV2G114_9ROSI